MSYSTIRDLCDNLLIHTANMRGEDDELTQQSRFGVYQPSGNTPLDAIVSLTAQIRDLVTNPDNEHADEILAYDGTGSYLLLNLVPGSALPEELVRQQGTELAIALKQAYPLLEAKEIERGDVTLYLAGDFQKREIPAELLLPLLSTDDPDFQG